MRCECLLSHLPHTIEPHLGAAAAGASATARRHLAAALQAARARAAFIVSPCCVGKLRTSFATCDGAASKTESSADESAAARATESAANSLAAVTGASCASATLACDQAGTPLAGSLPSASGSGGSGDPSTDVGPVAHLLRHPRSEWLRAALPEVGQFAALARAADISHTDAHAFPRQALLAKARTPLHAMARPDVGSHSTVMQGTAAGPGYRCASSVLPL